MTQIPEAVVRLFLLCEACARLGRRHICAGSADAVTADHYASCCYFRQHQIEERADFELCLPWRARCNRQGTRYCFVVFRCCRLCCLRHYFVVIVILFHFKSHGMCMYVCMYVCTVCVSNVLVFSCRGVEFTEV